MLLLPAQHVAQPLLAPTLTPSTLHSLARHSPSWSRAPRTDTERWAALTSRDPAHANSFVYAVMTTKIYCRPNCPSRLARRANVEFFTTAAEAVAAGYRPCKRCKPDQGEGVEGDGVEKVRRAVEVIKERSRRGEKVSLAELSKEVGLSKWHLQRAFKRRVGVSPREMGEQIEQGAKGKVKGLEGMGSEAEEASGVEAEILFAFPTPEWSFEEGLTDSKSSNVSSLPTPSSWHTMPDVEDMSWLTACQVGGDAPVVPPFGRDLNFADMGTFDPEVENMIRDLFPEIYHDTMDAGPL